jgi:hypothetical protein
MVDEAARAPLAAWESFYVIIGSSAAALTGLQFVVIALIAEARTRSTSREIAAFGTPTIVHFCAVLLSSAILSAPWPTLTSAGFALGACGVAGVVYAVLVVRRTRRQTGYTLVLEDWLWHALFPFVAYATLSASAFALGRDPSLALFGIALAAVLLLFIGIHNAWDAVTYIAVDRWHKPKVNRDES